MNGIVIKVGQQWRHKKTGVVYEIVATDADIQCSSAPELEALLADDWWIAYRRVNSHRLIFRPLPEFLDGRFDLAKDAE